MFTPYKKVGVVTDENPVLINRLGDQTFICASIYDTFQVYRYDNLSVCLTAKKVPEMGFDQEISAFAIFGHETYISVENKIYVYNRANIVRIYHLKSRVYTMTTIGRVLICIDEMQTLTVIDMKEREVKSQIHLINNNSTIIEKSDNTIKSLPNVTCTAMTHPDTYINKIVLGYSNGAIELWNFNTKKLIYSFESHIKKLSQSYNNLKNKKNGSSVTPTVTMLKNTSLCDIIAVGFSTGDILFINLKLDVIIASCKQSNGSNINNNSSSTSSNSVSCISFRKESLLGSSSTGSIGGGGGGSNKHDMMMATSGLDGNVFLWNVRVIEIDINNSSNNNDYDNSDDLDHDEFSSSSANINSSSKQSNIIQNKNNHHKSNHQLTKSTLHINLKGEFKAHSKRINTLQFIDHEPILLTTSLDNSIKLWIFDAIDGYPRILKSVTGHIGHPIKMRFYKNSSLYNNGNGSKDTTDHHDCEILSVNSDGILRCSSLITDSKTKEYSIKNIKKYLPKSHNSPASNSLGESMETAGLYTRKLPLITDFDFNDSREYNWGNLVTIHKHHMNAYIWKSTNKAITDIVLKPPTDVLMKLAAFRMTMKNNNSSNNANSAATTSSSITRVGSESLNAATSLSVSACGNFCVIGYQDGAIFKFNLQSGQSRGSYPSVTALNSLMSNTSSVSSTNSSSSSSNNHNLKKGVKMYIGHTQQVSGVFSDISSQYLTSISHDGQVKFWDYINHTLLGSTDLGIPLLLLRGFRDNGFVAVATHHHDVIVFDIYSQQIVRHLKHGHSRLISDIIFTPNSQYIITSSYDTTIRCWDLPLGRCISWYTFEAPVVSLAISPSSEFLCVGLFGKTGIHVNLDKSMYTTVYFNEEPSTPLPISGRVEEKKNKHTISSSSSLTGGRGRGGGDGNRLDSKNHHHHHDNNGVFNREHQFITLSSMPRIYCTNLYHLEMIHKRNQLQTARLISKKQIPFFLSEIVNTSSKNMNLSATSTNNQSMSVPVISDDNKKNKSSSGGSSNSNNTFQEQMQSQLAVMAAVGKNNNSSSSNKRTIMDTYTSSSSSSSSSGGVPAVAGVAVPHSRIFKSNQLALRSQLALQLIMCHVQLPAGTNITTTTNNSHHHHHHQQVQFDRVIQYLLQLSPSSVDIEIQQLCQNISDPLHQELLCSYLVCLLSQLTKGSNFEVLQAILYRTLLNYERILMNKEKEDELIQTNTLHQIGYLIHYFQSDFHIILDKYRFLIEMNLCILRLMTGTSDKHY